MEDPTSDVMKDPWVVVFVVQGLGFRGFQESNNIGVVWFQYALYLGSWI